MYTLNRKGFTQKPVLLAIGFIFIYNFSFSNPLSWDSDTTNMVSNQEASAAQMPNLGIIDLHAHPSLKMYLWNEHLWRRHFPSKGANIIAMQDDIHQLKSGYIKGFLATHYLPEAGIEKKWTIVKAFFPLIKRLSPSLVNKIEHEDPSNFKQIITMIDKMEDQIISANRKKKGVEFVLAKNYRDFKNARLEGKIAVAHAIEGAHALGRNFPISQKRKLKSYKMLQQNKMQVGSGLATKYIKNLDSLHTRGVCMMTLSHFFENDIAFPVEGISADVKKGLGMKWEYGPCDDKPLTPIGEAVVRRMLDIGMIVDITHTTPAVRKGVFEINGVVAKERNKAGKKSRPIIFSHTGAQKVFEKYVPESYRNYKYYCASDEEIKAISESGGVIGVIPEVFWLTGCDPDLKECGKEKFENGIPYIIETIMYIKSVTGSYDNISIGTDFDGLASAPRDLYIPSQLGDLINAIGRIPGITCEEIENILYKNAERVLELGWGD